jgi:hypothetical protein
MTLFSLAGSLNYASHIQQPESGLERKTSDTCGPKCLEQYGKFNHVGLWAKTFSALLIGTGDWYSTRCKLTWKLKGTKYNRLYFQLQASTLPTKGTEFGLLHTEMLPTPTMYDYNSARHPELWEKDKKKYAEKGINLQCGLKQMNVLGLLPTPTASDIHHAERVQKLKESGAETMASRKNGANRPNGLMDYLDFNQMLPTPTAQEFRDSQLTPEQAKKLDKGGRVLRRLGTLDLLEAGTTSQLNPQFVLEMMGFPPNWTELPFLNGETNQSKPPETPSCHK